LAFFGGSIFGGLLYDRYGGGQLFFWAAILACIALLLFLFINRIIQKPVMTPIQ